MQTSPNTTRHPFWSASLEIETKQAKSEDEQFKARLRQAVASGQRSFRISSNPPKGACASIL